MEPLLVNETQATHILSISRSTLRREMTSGRIRPVKVGRSVRFSTVELARYVEELQVERDGAAGQVGP